MEICFIQTEENVFDMFLIEDVSPIIGLVHAAAVRFGVALAPHSGESKMTKTYRIDVDCVNCAGEIECAVARCHGVAAAQVNVMTQKMTVTFAEGTDPEGVMQEVVRVCKKIEPDVTIHV